LGTTLNDPDLQTKISNDLKPLSALKDNLIGGYHSLSASSVDTQVDGEEDIQQ
jgi:hypothetical protein